MSKKRGRKPPTLEEQYQQYERQYDNNLKHFKSKWDFELDEKLSLEEFKTQYSIWSSEHSDVLQRNKIRNFTTMSIRMGDQKRITQLYNALEKMDENGKPSKRNKYGLKERRKALYTSEGYEALRAQISGRYYDLKEKWENGEIDQGTYLTFSKWFSHTYFGSD